MGYLVRELEIQEEKRKEREMAEMKEKKVGPSATGLSAWFERMRWRSSSSKEGERDDKGNRTSEERFRLS